MSMLFVVIAVVTLVFLLVAVTPKVAAAAFLDLSRYDNSPSGGASSMEIVSKKGLQGFVPLKESRLTGDVEGPLLNLSLSQTYSFTKAQSARPVEVLYRFPLPGDAAVKGAVVRFGDVEIETSLKDREKAQDEYHKARNEGRQAALVNEESGNVFTVAITGVMPDVEVGVLVNFVAVARPMEGGWELRFPLTIAPRYVRTDEAGTSQANANPLAVALDPGHHFSMDLKFKNAEAIASSTHELSVKTKAGVARVVLAKEKVTPDRDLLISWKPDLGGKSPFGGVMYTEKDGDDTYFLLLAAAEQGEEKAPRPLKREVSLLIDHSGSMEGSKWKASDWAAKKFLSDLEKDDHFAVAFFHNEFFPFSEKMLPATSNNVKKGIKFVTENTSSGGTELGAAMERMLMMPKVLPESKTARQFLVITDAQVTDEARILELARRESSERDRRRISVLCIDAAPNSVLTNRLAERGGGTAVYLTSNSTAGDVTSAVEEVLSRWSRPVAESVTLELEAENLHVPGRETRVIAENEPRRLKAELGSLMGGNPLWVIGKISGFSSKEPVRARFDSFEAEIRIEPARKGAKSEHDAIRTLYGARRIQELEFLKSSGMDLEELRIELLALGCSPEESGAKSGTKSENEKRPAKKTRGRVYEENEGIILKKFIDDLLLEESLKYGVVSSRTALVASRKEKGERVEETVLTPNALPVGWHEGFVSASFSRLSARRTGRGAASASRFSASASAGSFCASSCMSMPAMSCLSFDVEPEDDTNTEGQCIWDGKITVPGSGEIILKEFNESKTFSDLYLSTDSMKLLEKENLKGFIIRIYVDGEVTSSVAVKLLDLVKLGGERPLNLVCKRGVRFVLVNEGANSVALKKLTLFVR